MSVLLRIFSFVLHIVLVSLFLYLTLQDFILFLSRETNTAVAYVDTGHDDLPYISVCPEPPLKPWYEWQMDKFDENHPNMTLDNFSLWYLVLWYQEQGGIPDLPGNITSQQFYQFYMNSTFQENEVLTSGVVVSQAGEVLPLVSQAPKSPFIGDCPTFSFPQTKAAAMKAFLHLKNTVPSYKIYLFSRGSFYSNQFIGNLDNIVVKKGHHDGVFLSLQQFEKLALSDFYRSTVPEGTEDCEAAPTYNYDQVVNSEFLDLFNTSYGCVLPIYGAIYDPENYTLCLNKSLYSSDLVAPLYMGMMDRKLKSCKISQITYGPLHLLDGQNSTKLEISLPPQLYRTQESVKFTFTQLQSNIGGYLGLFLGVSLLQVNDIVRLGVGYLSALAKTFR